MFQVGVGATAEVWGEVVVLPENRSAVRAAVRLVEGRRTAHPLVLHGPPGAGKSAVVQTLIRQVIGGAEPRTVQVIPAAELPRAAEDLADLRGCDLLAVEDLHHLKEPDVENVCRLLDHRATRRRPTVVTAAAGPANLTDFPRRLTTRLAAGLVVRLDPPDLDGRKQLVEWFAAKRRLHLAPDAVEWLATTNTGIRPILGAVEQLRTVGKKSAVPLTSAQVQECLAEPGPERASTLERITAKVCEAFRVKRKELLGASRLRTVLVPRQVAMFLAREVAKLPLVQIGRHFGGRDHTTVLNAVRKVQETLAHDAKLAATVRELRSGLG